MSESAARRPTEDPVVRPLRRAGQRTCSRPGCSLPAAATLTFAYGLKAAHIDVLSDQPEPVAYDLCSDHADRTNPPYGWSLTDERPDEPIQPGKRPRDLGSDRTVAVLAAALRGDVGVEADLLGSPDDDLGDPARDPGHDAGWPDDAFDDEVLAELTDIATTAPETPPSPAPAPPQRAPGWQVPAARD